MHECFRVIYSSIAIIKAAGRNKGKTGEHWMLLKNIKSGAVIKPQRNCSPDHNRATDLHYYVRGSKGDQHQFVRDTYVSNV